MNIQAKTWKFEMETGGGPIVKYMYWWYIHTYICMLTYIHIYIFICISGIHAHTPQLQCWHRYFCNDANNCGSYRIKWLGQIVPIRRRNSKDRCSHRKQVFFFIKDFCEVKKAFVCLFFHWVQENSNLTFFTTQFCTSHKAAFALQPFTQKKTM